MWGNNTSGRNNKKKIQNIHFFILHFILHLYAICLWDREANIFVAGKYTALLWMMHSCFSNFNVVKSYSNREDFFFFFVNKFWLPHVISYSSKTPVYIPSLNTDLWCDKIWMIYNILQGHLVTECKMNLTVFHLHCFLIHFSHTLYYHKSLRCF